MERDKLCGNSTNSFRDFNSHAHVERDDTPYSALSVGNNFNSHAHVERDSTHSLSRSHLRYFNSHAHVERDKEAQTERDNAVISTHTLTWSVTCKAKFVFFAHTFQLTRSRGA